MPEWAFEKIMNLRQLVSMKRRIGDGGHVFHWWLSFRAELCYWVCYGSQEKIIRTGRKDNVHVYQPLHSSMVFVFPNQPRWDLEERSLWTHASEKERNGHRGLFWYCTRRQALLCWQAEFEEEWIVGSNLCLGLLLSAGEHLPFFSPVW